MARVPFLGRLFWREYIALLGSLILVLAEVVVRIITLALPSPIIRLGYRASRSAFDRLSSSKSKQARARNRSVSHSVANCSDFTELCALWGYYAEEHIVQTDDGYLLGVHRLSYGKHEDRDHSRVNAGHGSVSKPVVYLHHGLLMNSEIWVCLTDEERNLPFALVNKGYDVWLGNNRGNKYSKKSTKYSPQTIQFWDFCIDDFAFHDIPDTIHYVLKTTSQKTLSYIGFSQGTAQAFATLAIHPDLNDKVNLFIALAPAMSPAGLANGVVDALVKTSPDLLFLAFGRKSILSSATFWQSILYPPIFVRLIDASLRFLFGWQSKNMTADQKLGAYPHLYSFTSTKSVVHWFQIIRNKTFQMYDDDASARLSLSATDRYYKPARFPTKNIKTPIVLVYGESDSLVDIGVMLKELPRHTIATGIPRYEHLDFLWADDVDKLVFPHVFEALEYTTQHLDQSTRRTSHYLATKLNDTSALHRVNSSHIDTESLEDSVLSDSDFPSVQRTAIYSRTGTNGYAQRQQDSTHVSYISEEKTDRPSSANRWHEEEGTVPPFMNGIANDAASLHGSLRKNRSKLTNTEGNTEISQLPHIGSTGIQLGTSRASLGAGTSRPSTEPKAVR